MSGDPIEEDIVMPESEPESKQEPAKTKKVKTKSGLSRLIKKAQGKTVEKPKKARRCRAGTVVKREIQRLKRHPDVCLLKKIPFQNLVRSITQDVLSELFPSSKEQKQMKFEKGAIETFRLNCDKQLDAAVGAANIVNTSAGKESLSWESFDVLRQIRQKYPKCLVMFTPEHDRYNTLRYLVNRLINLGEKYGQIMHEIMRKDTAESCEYLRQKIKAIMTKRLRLASIKFDVNSSLADLERVYYEEYRKKHMRKQLSQKIKDAMAKGASASSEQVGELTLAYKNTFQKQ